METSVDTGHAPRPDTRPEPRSAAVVMAERKVLRYLPRVSYGAA